MATVYDFPVKKKLPKHLEQRLYGIAEDYIDALYDALEILCEDEENYDEMYGVTELVGIAFVEGLNDAVEKYEEEF